MATVIAQVISGVCCFFIYEKKYPVLIFPIHIIMMEAWYVWEVLLSVIYNYYQYLSIKSMIILL